MSYTELINSEKVLRTKFEVKINLDDSDGAEVAAAELRILARKIQKEKGACFHWANELAKIIENDRR